jgi:hypothetical protein
MNPFWLVDLVWGIALRALHLDVDPADLLPTPEYLRASRDVLHSAA